MPTKQSQENAGASRASVNRPHRTGALYVVGVSIGHPDDITVRAIQILKTMDLIASEDPQVTQQLLAHHHIQATVTSYGPRNLKEKAAVLLQRLRQGATIALVSDSGSPLVVDPGCLLVAGAHADGIPVIPIPGPSVVSAALSAAGFPCDSFYLLGFLPRTTPHLTRCLLDAIKRAAPTIAFCPAGSFARACSILVRIAPRRLVVLACDLTRPNETIVRGTSFQIQGRLADLRAKDITMVLAGKNQGRRNTHTRNRV